MSGQQASADRLARQQAELEARHRALAEEAQSLQAERARLERGEDAQPQAPHWRAESGRAGAPLWQLVDFHPGRPDAERAGLEAGLEAAGLLDAWITPDGSLLGADCACWPQDARWLARPPQPASLADWLVPVDGGAVAPEVLRRLLEGVAGAPQDTPQAEAWVSPGGRFRLGALTGAWAKPAVSENPNRVAIAAERLGTRCAPLVCTDGMPAAARRTLLQQPLRSGARLRCHADFDWAGVRIANHLLRHAGAAPWRMGASDYDAAARAARSARHALAGSDAQAVWDAQLAPAMRRHGLAIAEEAVADSLLDDLSVD